MNTNIIAKKISTLCSDRNISKQQLAERSGLTIEQLSLIEQSESFPSLAPMVKIARALGVRLGTLLDDMFVNAPVVSRTADHQSFSKISSHFSTGNQHLNFFSLAANKAERNMEPFLIEIHAFNDESVYSSHEGEEFLYVLDGQVVVKYGTEEYVLMPGDSIYYDSIVEHLVGSANGCSAHILAVVYTPF